MGMFGGDVHLRTYADLERCGISPYLGRIGMDDWSRPLAPLEFTLAGVAARTERSAQAAARRYTRLCDGGDPKAFWGETPWRQMIEECDLDVLVVATPDDLHFAPAMYAMQLGKDVLLEKPMCLDLREADKLLDASRRQQVVLGIDMHKRYDPDHLYIFRFLRDSLGDPLYARAVLEEPLHVSTQTFKWAERSNPFSYVGVHWTDLFIHYLNLSPRSVWASGQRKKLSQEYGKRAFDAVQVSVCFDGGFTVFFNNSWINPNEFEGPVNQECDVVFTKGKVESDTQYRGLRFHLEGEGTRTANTHFMRQVRRPDLSETSVGYGKDSIIACLAAISRRRLFQEKLVDLEPCFPNAKEGRLSVAILHAARAVLERNAESAEKGLGAPFVAQLGKEGIFLVNPDGARTQIYDGDAS